MRTPTRSTQPVLSLLALAAIMASGCVYMGTDDTGTSEYYGDTSSHEADTGPQTGFCESAEPCTGDYSIASRADLDDVRTCESISGALIVEYLDWLTSIDLPCLTSVEGELSIGDNDHLRHLKMPNLSYSGGGGLTVRDSHALTKLDLSSLTAVAGDLYIADNNALTKLDGISSLTSVGYQLVIWGNDDLTGLDGLSNLSSVGKARIFSNDALCQRDAEAFAGAIDSESEASVYDNAGNCD
ncbi:MAG: hypothetical protein QGG40_05780 [Myxococcota bacterium]|nr:hypothetical protein [Myxococcota bacterium]